MATIWKFPLRVTDEQTVSVPEGAQPLTVQTQNGEPFLWAIVDPKTPLRDLLIVRIHGTGHTFDATGYLYIATFQIPNGAFVFHAFVAERR